MIEQKFIDVGKAYIMWRRHIHEGKGSSFYQNRDKEVKAPQPHHHVSFGYHFLNGLTSHLNSYVDGINRITDKHGIFNVFQEM